jgi:hypothetical protein
VRLASAASLSLLLIAPALAGNTATFHVGLVVTGHLAAPLAGTWDARSAARGTIYHFVVSHSSGVFYQLVSVPLRETGVVKTAFGAPPAAARCDLRVSGVITSLEPASSGSAGAGYEMRYVIEAAQVVTSSSNTADCQEVADAYLSEAPASASLMLSPTSDGRLTDRATGAEYVRRP